MKAPQTEKLLTNKEARVQIDFSQNIQTAHITRLWKGCYTWPDGKVRVKSHYYLAPAGICGTKESIDLVV